MFGAALWEACMVFSSGTTGDQSPITFTSICTERLFPEIGSNRQLRSASHVSELVLAMGPDIHFVYGSGSEPTCCQICGFGC